MQFHILFLTPKSVCAHPKRKKNVYNAEYKEENKITSPIEIDEEVYNRELKKLNDIYESAQGRYMKYVEVIFPPEEGYERFPKKESVLSVISLIFSCIPIVGVLLAVIDLVHDKYNLELHKMSYFAIMMSTLMALGLVITSNLLY